MNHLIKISVCGLFLLSSVAVADSNTEAAQNVADSGEETLALPCGEKTGYKLMFAASEISIQGWRSVRFIPAQYYGKQIYCKKSGLVFSNGTAISNSQLGVAYFANYSMKNTEPRLSSPESNDDVTDPELKRLLAESDKKAKEDADSGIAEYGKKIRIQAGKKDVEKN